MADSTLGEGLTIQQLESLLAQRRRKVTTLLRRQAKIEQRLESAKGADPRLGWRGCRRKGGSRQERRQSRRGHRAGAGQGATADARGRNHRKGAGIGLPLDQPSVQGDREPNV